MTTFKTPCSADCLCASGKSASTKQFNASLEYETGGEKRVEAITLEVPADAHMGEIKQIMSCAVRDRIKPQGSHNGFLRFRLDGRKGDLSLLQLLQDIWFRITWRGTPFTGSHFVPIWDAPPAR